MPESSLNRIEELLADQRGNPPIEKWHPDLSGDIDIRIDRDGRWFHEGAEIQRKALVKLFASILRCEEDGEYYLVTPVEKWRIQVEDAPLQAIDAEIEGEGGDRRILFTTNHDRRYLLDAEHPLRVETRDGEPRPYLTLERGLEALVQRAVFYRLVENAAREVDTPQGKTWVIDSCGETFTLGST